MRSIVTITVIDFFRSQWHPGHSIRCQNPTDIPWSPIDLIARWRYPAPAMRRDIRPATIVIRRPPPGFLSDPDIIATDPYPAAVTIRGPIDRDRGGWSPYIAILTGLNPPAVSTQIPAIDRQFWWQILFAVLYIDQHIIPLPVPSFPVARRAECHEYG